MTDTINPFEGFQIGDFVHHPNHYREVWYVITGMVLESEIGPHFEVDCFVIRADGTIGTANGDKLHVKGVVKVTHTDIYAAMLSDAERCARAQNSYKELSALIK